MRVVPECVALWGFWNASRPNANGVVYLWVSLIPLSDSTLSLIPLRDGGQGYYDFLSANFGKEQAVGMSTAGLGSSPSLRNRSAINGSVLP